MDWLDSVRAMINATVGFYFVDEAATSPTKDDYLKTHPVPPPARQGRIHARRMWPFGFRSIIPKGVECVTVSPMGSQTQKVIVGAESNAYGPTDLAEGDSVVYSKAHREGVVCIVRVYADGQIRIETSENGRHVVVKPGTAGKVKLGDDADANLDPVVLYTALKTQFDDFVSLYNNHTHGPGTFAVAAAPGVVAGTSAQTAASANNLTTAVRSANVVAKKP